MGDQTRNLKVMVESFITAVHASCQTTRVAQSEPFRASHSIIMVSKDRALLLYAEEVQLIISSHRLTSESSHLIRPKHSSKGVFGSSCLYVNAVRTCSQNSELVRDPKRSTRIAFVISSRFNPGNGSGRQKPTISGRFVNVSPHTRRVVIEERR